jgi:hypothetical protein
MFKDTGIILLLSDKENQAFPGGAMPPDFRIMV